MIRPPQQLPHFSDFGWRHGGDEIRERLVGKLVFVPRRPIGGVGASGPILGRIHGGRQKQLGVVEQVRNLIGTLVA